MTKETAPADICLILEGTYPYVTGGVSAWTHRLITHLPEFRFHLLCLVPDEEPRRWAYPKPGNVVGQTDVGLSTLPDGGVTSSVFGTSTPQSLFDGIASFHHDLLGGDPSGFPDLFRQFAKVSDHAGLFLDLLTSRPSWKILQDLYTQQFHEESFLDFFWMWRTTHVPLFRVLSLPIPKAGAYHALSTGYAGMLGVMGNLAHQRPFLLTEHGIYTRERRIEIALAEWIESQRFAGGTIRPVSETVRGFWMRIFEQIGRIVYHHADPVITLFEGNRDVEIREGADPDRVRIIPNGISLSEGRPRSPRLPGEDRIVALIGRVVPIKDVKTFLLAAHIVGEQEASVRFLVLGPTDQDPDYAAECRELSESLDLAEKVTFTGNVDLSRYYPDIDILVLTSLSESQPLVIMEAYASGIPVVASRVGACEDPDRPNPHRQVSGAFRHPHRRRQSPGNGARHPEASAGSGSGDAHGGHRPAANGSVLQGNRRLRRLPGALQGKARIMAGIGFALRKLLGREELSSVLTGFFLSAIVAAGPWILTTVGLLVIGSAGASSFVDAEHYLRFRSIVTFLFAASLILSSPLQIPMTRTLADRFYAKDTSSVRSLLFTTLALAFLPGLALAAIAVATLRLPPAESLATVDLFLVLTALWITTAFITTLRDYNSVGLAFLLGNAASIAGVFKGAQYGDLAGALTGYTIGQGLILTILLVRFVIEFSGPIRWDMAGIRFLAVRWDLAVLGFFLNFGIWIDKILYWYGPGSEKIVGFIRMNKDYDIGMFFALLMVIPTLALFVAYFETGFYEQYRFFFAVIHGGYPFREIERAKERMLRFLRQALSYMIKIQGSITLLVLLNAHNILAFFHADFLSLPVFRIGSMGAFLQVIFILEVTLLLYLNRGDVVLKLAFVLFASNLLLTLVCLAADSRFEGMGYFLACFLVALWGYRDLDIAFREFEYTVFMRQPVSGA